MLWGRLYYPISTRFAKRVLLLAKDALVVWFFTVRKFLFLQDRSALFVGHVYVICRIGLAKDALVVWFFTVQQILFLFRSIQERAHRHVVVLRRVVLARHVRAQAVIVKKRLRIHHFLSRRPISDLPLPLSRNRFSRISAGTFHFIRGDLEKKPV